jgi:hypothetical protein
MCLPVLQSEFAEEEVGVIPEWRPSGPATFWTSARWRTRLGLGLGCLVFRPELVSGRATEQPDMAGMRWLLWRYVFVRPPGPKECIRSS